MKKCLALVITILVIINGFILNIGASLATDVPVITSPSNNATYSMNDTVCSLTWTEVPEATKYCFALWDTTGGNEVQLNSYDGYSATFGNCYITDSYVQPNHSYKVVVKARVNGAWVCSDPVYFNVGPWEYDSEIVDQSIPTSVDAGVPTNASITFRNTGSLTWSDGNPVKLRISDDYAHLGLNYMNPLNPGESVAPGASKTFQFTMTADASGTYGIRAQLVYGDTSGFGAHKTVNITSTPGPATLSYDAVISADFPSGLVVGQSYTINVLAKNTGQATWQTNNVYIQLKTSSNSSTTIDKKNLAAAVAPGATATFSFTIKSDTKQSLGFEWQMINGSTPFGASLYKAFSFTEIKPTNVSLDVSGCNLKVGETLQLHATLSPSDATNKQIDWFATNSGIATVSSQGLVTAKTVGHTVIYAQCLGNPDITDTCIIDVVSTVAVTDVKLNYTCVSKKISDIPFQLTATVFPAEANDKRILWSTSDSRIATVSELGVVSPEGVGTATITAKSAANSSIKATCTVIIGGTYKAVQSVTLNKTTLSFTKGGGSQTLIATVSPTDANDPSIQWISDNSQIASVSSSGTVTPGNTGTTTIYARSIDDPTKKATCSVTVSEVPPPATVKLTLDSPSDSSTVYIGDPVTIKGTASGLKYLQIYVKNVSTGDCDNPGGTFTDKTSVSTTWSTSGKAAGKYWVKIQGLNTPNTTPLATQSAYITLQEKPKTANQPVVTSITVNNNQPIIKGQNNNLVPIEFTGKADAGIKSVSFYVLNKGSEYLKETISPPTAKFKPWDISGTNPGTYQIKIKMIDSNNAPGEELVTVEVKDAVVQKGLPMVTSITVNNNQPIIKGQNNNLVPIEFIGKADAGIKSVAFYVVKNGREYLKETIMPPTSKFKPWDISGTSPGTYQIKIKMTDSNNEPGENVVSIEVKQKTVIPGKPEIHQNNKPIIRIDCPLDNQIYPKGTISVHAESSPTTAFMNMYLTRPGSKEDQGLVKPINGFTLDREFQADLSGYYKLRITAINEQQEANEQMVSFIVGDPELKITCSPKPAYLTYGYKGPIVLEILGNGFKGVSGDIDRVTFVNQFSGEQFQAQMLEVKHEKITFAINDNLPVGIYDIWIRNSRTDFGVKTSGFEVKQQWIVEINGSKIRLDPLPYYDSNSKTLMVPLRQVLGAIGGKIKKVRNNILLLELDKSLEVLIGTNQIRVNGWIKKVNAKTVVKDGTTFVPEFILSQLGANVDWAESSNYLQVRHFVPLELNNITDKNIGLPKEYSKEETLTEGLETIRSAVNDAEDAQLDKAISYERKAIVKLKAAMAVHKEFSMPQMEQVIKRLELKLNILAAIRNKQGTLKTLDVIQKTGKVGNFGINGVFYFNDLITCVDKASKNECTLNDIGQLYSSTGSIGELVLDKAYAKPLGLGVLIYEAVMNCVKICDQALNQSSMMRMNLDTYVQQWLYAFQLAAKRGFEDGQVGRQGNEDEVVRILQLGNCDRAAGLNQMAHEILNSPAWSYSNRDKLIGSIYDMSAAMVSSSTIERLHANYRENYAKGQQLTKSILEAQECEKQAQIELNKAFTH